MSKFKGSPMPLKAVEVDRDRLAEFTGGAEASAETAAAIAKAPRPPNRPRAKSAVSKHDPKAKPTTGVSLRLNEYELDLVRIVAEREDKSIQKVLRGIVLPALERLL